MKSIRPRLAQLAGPALACALVALAAPSPARAGCAWAPPPSISSVPPDGATAVATDAELWVLSGFAETVTVTFEGAVSGEEQAPFGAWRRWRLAGVAPGDSVGWSVSLGGSGAEHPYGPFSFQVGSEPADAPAKPALDHVESLHDGALTSTCDGLLTQQECFDTGQSLLVRLHLAEQPAAPLYRFCERGTGSSDGCGLTFAMPGTCTPALLVHDTAGSKGGCYEVAAINAAGAASEELIVCAEDGEDGQPPSTGSSGGCAATRGAPGGQGVLAALALLALAARRRAARWVTRWA